MKFKDLVTKKKSELVELAKEEGIKSPYNKKKNDLIKSLSDEMGGQKEELLNCDSDDIKETASELGLEYTTKGETIARIVEEDNNSEDNEQEDRGSWREELDDAIELAIKNALSHKMKYNIYDKVDDPVDNLFNVAPAYMKSPEGSELVLSINITEYTKQML